MNYSALSHRTDGALLRDLAAAVARDRTATAELVALIAVVEERKLFRPEGHPSMLSYCVGVLGMAEDAALKRIRVARVAREFPAIFEALADGRIHMTTVLLLNTHLNLDNVDELLAAAAHKTKSEIELMLAHRSPRPDVATRIEAIPSALTLSDVQLAPEPGKIGRLLRQSSRGRR